MPSLGELVRKAGVQLPARADNVATVQLGEVFPVIGDPKHSEASRKALANIEAVREAGIIGAATFGAPYRAAHVALKYPDFLEAVKNIKAMQAAIERERANFGDATPETLRFCKLFRRDLHTTDFQGYLNYVCDISENYRKALQRIPKPILADAIRQQHTYISGSAGTGKTELLKALVHHDVTQRQAAAVIIDPTGNFARAVAMWPEFSGEGRKRLVYVNPKLRDGWVPSLNPLDAEHLGQEERGILANQLTNVLAQVVGKGEWTTQTETVASACFQVLVNRKGATLRDLRLALVEGDKKGPPHPVAAEIVRLGAQHHVAEVRDFFAYEFASSQYATSKGSLRAKIGHMLRNELFADMTGLPSKIVLEELIDARKTIVFDLGAWGDNAAAGAFGRLVIAQVAAVGMRRSTRHGEAHTPVHLYVDEADLFVGPAVLNILSKLRQHGVHLTLAQQTVGYGFEGQDKHQLLNNTAVKFTAGDGQREMLAMMHASADATRGLKQGEFIGRWGRDGEVFKLAVRADLLGNTRAMTPDEWEEVVAYQVKRYYTAKGSADVAPTATLEPTPPKRRRRL